MQQAFPLEGKVAIVTGASGGIGSTIARAMLANAASVVLTGKTNTQLRKRYDALMAMGVPEDHVLSIAADLSDPSAGAAVVGATMQRFGRVDILVNCAGVGVFKRFNALNLDEITDVVGSNLMSTLYMTHHATEALMASQGHIVNIGSGLGRRGAARATAYAAAKFGVQGFTESLRLDMGRYGVRVSGISPAGGGVDTPFWEKADPNVKRQGMLAPERIAEAVLIVLTARENALIDDMTVRTG